MSSFRTEHDFLGDKQIPAHAYWGVHTARAVENFAISGTPLAAMPELIRAFGHVKKAAAFEPIMGWSLHKSIRHLSNACLALQAHCVVGIEANHALLAKTAIATGKPVVEVAEELGILTREQIEAFLVPRNLTHPLRLSP